MQASRTLYITVKRKTQIGIFVPLKSRNKGEIVPLTNVSLTNPNLYKNLFGMQLFANYLH